MSVARQAFFDHQRGPTSACRDRLRSGTVTPIATQSALPQPPAMSGEAGNQIIEAVEATSLLQEDGGFAVSYFNLEFNPQMATSLVHCLNRRYNGARKFPVTAPDAARHTAHLGARSARVPGASAERVVRPDLCEESRRGCGIQSTMHLLRWKNTQPGTQQFRHKRMALRESGLPTKLRHRSEFPGWN